MRSLLRRLRRIRGSAHPSAEAMRVVVRKDLQRSRPVFKAPSLPTPQPMGYALSVAKQLQKRPFRRD